MISKTIFKILFMVFFSNEYRLNKITYYFLTLGILLGRERLGCQILGKIFPHFLILKSTKKGTTYFGEKSNLHTIRSITYEYIILKLRNGEISFLKLATISSSHSNSQHYVRKSSILQLILGLF